MKRPQNTNISLAGVAMCLSLTVLSGCGTDIPSRAAHQPLQAAIQPAPILKLTRTFDPGSPCGWASCLESGTRLQPIGSVVEGTVYRPTNAVFTISGRHQHEADLVIRDNQLVGFHLAAENGFIALDSPVQVPCQQEETP